MRTSCRSFLTLNSFFIGVVAIVWLVAVDYYALCYGLPELVLNKENSFSKTETQKNNSTLESCNNTIPNKVNTTDDKAGNNQMIKVDINIIDNEGYDKCTILTEVDIIAVIAACPILLIIYYGLKILIICEKGNILSSLEPDEVEPLEEDFKEYEASLLYF